jgi:hypothetical protein
MEWLQNEIGLLPVSNWDEAAQLMNTFMREKEVMESYRNALLVRWKTWKERLGTQVRKVFSLE